MDLDQGLLTELFSTSVISSRELENVRVKSTSFDRNECLIQLLRRKSQRDFGVFVDALRTVGQSHIADILCSSS